ncbi:MAG: shikimate kinase [Herbinix sp.]|nr:shikimate kinase [Herbinix sp.]
MIEKKYNFKYYKLDDKLEEYTKKASEAGKTYSSKYYKMNTDEIWLRTPAEQNIEEFEIYKEIFEYVLEDLKQLQPEISIIAEGAGFLPELMDKIGVPKNEYICIVPAKEFQIEKYSQRPYIPYVLEGSSDKKRAFQNWMERDALFAIDVVESARELGYPSIITNYETSIEENLAIVEKVFELN